MTTAAALAQVTDRGKFERVAIQILRQFDGECTAVLRSGTNALDEPIPSPMDGFCRVPGRHPPRFVLIECTTTDPPGLHAKWLSGGAGDGNGARGGSRPAELGDLVKAAREAGKLRARFLGASFKIHLVVNQPVRLSLYADVQHAADGLDVECEVWDLSRLADLLDRPEGQVFRRELGIAVRDLSRGLLAEVGRASLEQARREALTNPGLWVDRAVGVRLRSLFEGGGHRLIVLVAGPGRGKTALGLQALDAHLRAGGLSLCVDAERVGDCHNLDEAVGRTLQSLAPDLGPGQGQTYRQLLEPGRPLLVLLEDVNRADRPARLLQKFIAWARPSGASSPVGGGRVSVADGLEIVVLVPVWPAYTEEVAARLKESPWVATLEVDRMEPGEADEALRRVLESASLAVGSARRREISNHLERDPVLIGLLGRLLDSDVRRDPTELSADVVGHYLERCIEETVEQTGRDLLKNDVSLALDHLADHLLRHRELNPLWSTVHAWFSSDPRTLGSITALAKHGGIVRTGRAGEDNRLIFRHDRLMQEVLSRSLAASTEHGDPPDALFDPFFAEMTGQALRRVTLGRELLRDVADRCPLALFEAVRASRSDDDPGSRAVIEEAADWCVRRRTAGEMLPAVFDSIARSLLSTDSPHVIEFVQLLPRHPLLMLAGLRNGSADCGVSYLAGPRYFWAESRDHQLESTVEMALARHRARIIRDLASVLRVPGLSDERKKGAIELTGYLETSELEEAVAECYRSAQDQGIVFIPTLWAALRCLGEDPCLLAIPMVEAWCGLSNMRDEQRGESERGKVTQSLRLALAQGVQDRTVRFLTEDYHPADGDFEWLLFLVLEFVDHPDAIEYRVRYSARRCATLKPGHISFAVKDVTRPWDIDWEPIPRRLSDASLARARGLWDDPDNDVHVRDTAFQVWLTQCRTEDLPALRAIEPSSALFRYAVRVRASLGDSTCVPALIEEIRQFSWYFRLAPPVWCAELHQLADEHLASFEGQIPSDFTGGCPYDHYALSDMLMRIPQDQAEGLFIKHWGHLKYSRRFIQSALFVGTTRCLELADASIRESPSEVDIFKHVCYHFGLMMKGRQDLVTRDHLERLLPYIDRMDDFTVNMIADFCNHRGYQDWVREHLQPFLTAEHRKHVCPTAEDIELVLDQLAEENTSPTLEFWVEGAARLVPPGQLIAILRRWLASKSGPSARRVTAEVIASVGTLTDLEILDGFPPFESAEERSVVENARYRVDRRTLR